MFVGQLTSLLKTKIYMLVKTGLVPLRDKEVLFSELLRVYQMGGKEEGMSGNFVRQFSEVVKEYI
jgi:hypothetical protein